MLDRTRNWAGRAVGGRRWARMLYLTDISAAVMVILIYLFNFRIRSSGTFTLLGPAAIAVAYGVFFLLWFLVESFGLVENVRALERLYPNAGVRWLDAAMGILAALGMALAWRAGFANEAIWAIGGLTLANSLISLLQLRLPYFTYTPPSADPVPEPPAAPAAE